MRKRSLILNIPHSSVNGIFDEETGRWPRDARFINECVNKMTDWWTDMLFSVEGIDYDQVIFPFSRFVCDAERLIDDPMEAIGQGILYKEFDGFKRGELTEENRLFLMRQWERHREKLSECIKSDDSVLVDCHSFPSEYADVDVCIGFNEDWSFNEDLVGKTVELFRQWGYSVGINHPYSNSITPESPHRYTSIMIEVNKRIYMNEKTMQLERNARQWLRWKGCLVKVFETLAKH